LARQDTVDPRVTRTRQVVLTAVLEELADVGHAHFTIESVAARCGVGKSTIYRHWDGKLQMILDAMRELNTQPVPEPDGPPRERIRQLLHHLGHALTEGSLAAAIPALIEAAERDPEVRRLLNDYTAERRRALGDALILSIEAGQVDRTIDVELAAQALSGAIFYARLMTSTPLTGTGIDQLINTVLGAD
jgi:TetR/AcrR family transcriptional regulator, regulator of autoinduction and epiphytic fitness